MSRATVAGVLTVLLAMTSGCKGGPGHASADSAADAGPHVNGAQLILPDTSQQIAAVSVASVAPSGARTRRLNGRLTWDEDVTVRVFAPFAGQVVEAQASVGQAVHTGEVLATIASPDFGQAQADARRATTDLAQAERTLARLTDLLQHGVVAQKDVEAAQADAARARAEQQRAVARLKFYGIDSAAAMQLFPLRSQINGIVVERTLNAGQEVRPDQMLANAPALFAPLFVVSDPVRLWVQLDLPESDLETMQSGAVMTVRTLAWPDRAFAGRVVLVASSVDSTSHTVKVRGTVANPGRLLRAGMLVTVDVPDVTHHEPTIPSAAVLRVGDKAIVFVEESRGHFRRTEVTVGAQYDGTVPVRSGLKPGDRVVTAGSLLLEQLFQGLAH